MWVTFSSSYSSFCQCLVKRHCHREGEHQQTFDSEVWFANNPSSCFFCSASVFAWRWEVRNCSSELVGRKHTTFRHRWNAYTIRFQLKWQHSIRRLYSSQKLLASGIWQENMYGMPERQIGNPRFPHSEHSLFNFQQEVIVNVKNRSTFISTYTWVKTSWRL